MTLAAPKRAKPFLDRIGLKSRAARLKPCDDGSGLPFDADAPQRRRDVPPIGVAIGTLADKLGVAIPADEGPTPAAGAPAAEETLLAAWRETAGPLADKLVPEKFTGGILYVLGGTSAEIFEIRRTKLRAIEAKAKTLAPFAGLRQIRIKSTPWLARR